MSRGADRLQRCWASRGLVARLLLPIAWLYAAAIALRGRLYRAGVLTSTRLPVPVVVVGNLVAGGAGKTPAVLALVALLREADRRPGIVSRGYGGSSVGPLSVHPGSAARECGDEPLLLRLRAGVPVFVGHDRVAAARALLLEHTEVDVIVSDDGLQHLRLGRDVQVLVFDERGAGNGWLLPAGPLREPMPRAVRPGSIVLYNASQPTTALPGWVGQRRLSGAVALGDWWRGQGPDVATLAALKVRAVVAAAGTARPERFFTMLRETGLDIDPLPLPDHFDYAALPWAAGTCDVIVTEKDAVKLDPARVGDARVWVAALDFVPAPEFDAEMLRLLGRTSPSRTPPAHGNPTA